MFILIIITAAVYVFADYVSDALWPIEKILS
jgi:hypothetical protein